MMFLTITDTAGIQSYVFGSNRLRENIGASFLVAEATEGWANHAAEGVLRGSTVYAGGGNQVSLFQTEAQATDYERVLTRRALREAPGLDVVVVRHSFDPATQTLGNALHEAFKELGRRKAERARSTPLLGLSVTRACQSTGRPATGTWKVEKDTYYAAPDILAKVDRVTDARNRMEEALPVEPYGYPNDFEHLGRSRHEDSYIAVIHADGNGLGQRLKKITDGFTDPGQNEACRKAIKAFSQAVKEASAAALTRAVGLVVGCVEHEPGGCSVRPRLDPDEADVRIPMYREMRDGQAVDLLPLRPLVFGGDDVTLVCDGRLGVAFAEAYLRFFAEETNNRKDALGGSGVTACAGVAIVKSRFPFARAYALSESLCKGAKEFRRENKRDNEPDFSALDWHFAASGLQGSLSEIRERELTVTVNGARQFLYQRPVSVGEPPVGLDPVRRWESVRKEIHRFQGADWRGKRSKVKELRDALRHGQPGVEKFVKLHPREKDVANAWSGSRCRLFDAVEIADLYFPLEVKA